MSKLLLALSALILLCLPSCKKDKMTTTDPSSKICDIVYVDYSHLKEGNYWIYEIFDVDSLGNAFATGKFDSVYAGPEQIINGRSYQVRLSPDASGMYTGYPVRDSLHYLVTQAGTIKFSSVDFNTIFNSKYFVWTELKDTVALVQHQMKDKNLKVKVPAGEFETSSYTETWDMYEKHVTGGYKTRAHKTRYNINIGVVSEVVSFYLYDRIYQERRLVRYKVK